MPSKKFICLSLMLQLLSSTSWADPLPGREGNENIYTARFGQTRMFFYMSPEKAKLTRFFSKDVSQRMLHRITEAELDCPVNEITPVATTDPDPISYDLDGKPLYLDQLGSETFIGHAKEVKRLAELALGINITALSQEMSLIINYDANKFHQDQCPVQYNYLKHHPHPIPRYTIYQDLTLINWEMAEKTFSGTILEDAESEDSFIMFFSNNELCCNVYTEPAIYLGPNQPPEYPGAATLSPHSPIPPIDYSASKTPGSGKGKRISVAVRGLVETSQIDELESRAIPIEVDRPKILESTSGLKTYSYKNNIYLREVENSFPISMKMDRVIRMSDIDEVEVYTSNPEYNQDTIEKISKEFGITDSIESTKVFHLIKRGEGFSELSTEALGLDGEYTLLILNSSQIPENYRQYPVAIDLTRQGTPWIQLYHFPHNRIMCVDSSIFPDLSLTPIDEILFRDGIYDIAQSDPNTIFQKFFTLLHLIAVPKMANLSEVSFGN